MSYHPGGSVPGREGRPRKPRVFYGWVVVAAVFTVLTFAAGLGFYNATVYLQALVDERGFSIGAASGATAVFFVVFVLGIAPVALLFVRSSPGAMGLHPDGADEPNAEERGLAPGVAFREAVRTPFFVVVTFGFALLLLTQVGGLANLFPLAIEGAGAAAAATTVSTVAFASIAGRFAGAWVLGRVSPMRFTVGIAVLQAAAIALLAFASSPVVLLAGAVLFGATVGNILILAPIVLVSAFGIRDYPSIYSVNQLLTTVGIAAGPVLIGVLRDATAGYTTPLLIAAGVSLAAACALAFAHPLGETG